MSGRTAQAERGQADGAESENVFRKTLTIENKEFAEFMRRIIAAAGRRIETHDPESLKLFLALEKDLKEALAKGVKGLREQGFSWSEIGRAIGVKAQTVHERWRHV